MSNLKLDVVVHAKGSADFDDELLIPMLHRWIQESRLDELMIDIADYRHVAGGPGVILVCHSGLYMFARSEQGLALTYSRRRIDADRPYGGLEGALLQTTLATLAACSALEESSPRESPLRFQCDRISFRVNDRSSREPAAPTLRSMVSQLLGAVATDGRVETHLATSWPAAIEAHLLGGAVEPATLRQRLLDLANRDVAGGAG